MEGPDLLATCWYSEKAQKTADFLQTPSCRQRSPEERPISDPVGSRPRAPQAARPLWPASLPPSALSVSTRDSARLSRHLIPPSHRCEGNMQGPCTNIHPQHMVERTLPPRVPASVLPVHPHRPLPSCSLSAHPCLCLPPSLSLIFSPQKDTDLWNIPFELQYVPFHIYDVIALFSKYSTCIFEPYSVLDTALSTWSQQRIIEQK